MRPIDWLLNNSIRLFKGNNWSGEKVFKRRNIMGGRAGMARISNMSVVPPGGEISAGVVNPTLRVTGRRDCLAGSRTNLVRASLSLAPDSPESRAKHVAEHLATGAPCLDREREAEDVTGTRCNSLSL